MMTREAAKSREQVQFVSLDDLVPKDHLVRKLENAIDWRFIYELVEETYSVDNGRPSLDPVTLIKLPILQYMFGIRSMRQTVREVEVNNRKKKEKHIKVSNTDPESGWFRKGEHKNVFAHSIQTACDENGVILGYSVHPGNDNDGKTFPAVMEKLEDFPVELVVADSAYKTPAIARFLSKKGIGLLSTHKKSQTKDGFFPKYEYVYDEHFDCYLCPNDQVLQYYTTNRDGYREYRSDPKVCANCPHLAQCTESKAHLKTVTRHIWAEYVEAAEEGQTRREHRRHRGRRRDGRLRLPEPLRRC